MKYNLIAFKQKIDSELRLVERAKGTPFDTNKIQEYFNRTNLSSLSDQEILQLNGYLKNDIPTLLYVLLFSIYPQAFFPNLCLTAVVVPGKEMGQTDKEGFRFIDNKRIEGTIPDILKEATSFVLKNMTNKTYINPDTGTREDKSEYPVVAIREAILNALLHRDYSIYTENQPITLIMYQDRIEISNPGGLYGRGRIETLGKVNPDTRNPSLIKYMEVVNLTENRYSGIPTIRRYMEEENLPEPVFEDLQGNFKVNLYNSSHEEIRDDIYQQILNFCQEPRSVAEIAEHFHFKTAKYLKATYLQPLLLLHKLKETLPDKPKSKFQKYVTVEKSSS